MKVAAMQASLEREDKAATVSVLFASSNHLGESITASTSTMRTGNVIGIKRPESNDLDMICGATDAARQRITTAGDQLSFASRQRRLALLDQRQRQAARVTLSECDKTQALQNMLRIYENEKSISQIGKVNGRRSTLADPGAMVSATTAKNMDRFVTVVDTTDTVQLQSFSGRKEPMLCLGSVFQQVISEATDGSLSVNVYKNYLLSDESDIDIMSTDDLVIWLNTQRIQAIRATMKYKRSKQMSLTFTLLSPRRTR